jgi:uncharacterized protein (DUF58 family)
LIYPTPRAAILAAFGGPLALVAGVMRDEWWIIGAIWCGVLSVGVVIDALLGKALSSARVVDKGFPHFSIARPETWQLVFDFGGAAPPRGMTAALACDPRLGLEHVSVGGTSDAQQASFDFSFRPLRRGKGEIKTANVRWRGPLGLVWKQKHVVFDHEAVVTTNIRGVKEDALRWFSRYAMFGSKIDRTIGEGTEFHALRDFQTGMDRRTVDWKQSARHGKLLAKEFRTERNHNIIFALDAGRTMCEPIGAAPRIDRAIEAALLTALACLRGGDKAGFFAFDAKPRLSTGALGGGAAFVTLQHCAGEIDYSAEETNYVLGLATLSGELKRRSLIVVFTEFGDQTAAQLMIEALGRLVKRHLIIFVAFKDEELEALQDAPPNSADDVSRAVVAASILGERDLVLAKLRAMGAYIVEGRARDIGPAIISTYLDLKARDLL